MAMPVNPTAAKSVADRRKLYLQRWGSLRAERSSWFTHWRELSEYLMPRNGRFLLTDRNRGDKRHNRIYDNTGIRAGRILAAGLMSGMTSPARPWFRLATPDADLMKRQSVKQWCAAVTGQMLDIFARSNTYRALHGIYGQLGVFGTAGSLILDDFEDVIRHYPLAVGEYAIATDDRGVVNTVYREFEMTVSQMVKRFGIDNVSPRINTAYQNGQSLDTWYPVMHTIEPRTDRDPRLKDATNMAYASCYFETGGDAEKLLSESGFKRFPGVVPRWDVESGDIYGNSPGMEALGDAKQLQHEQFRKGQAIDFATLPPLQAPVGMKAEDVRTLPGGVTFVAQTAAGKAIAPLWDIKPDLNPLLGDIQDVRQRINASYYTDLFLMISQSEESGGSPVTAREIAERHEEKLLMLGPVLERLHDELLAPKVEITFEKMLLAGTLPPPPAELQGQDLNIQFISMLAQAQRAVGTGALDRLLGTIGSMAKMKPDVLDKIDSDKVVDAYADMLGVDPDLIVGDDQVALIRQQRAQQMQQQQALAAAPQAAQTAKTMSETDTSGQNAYTDAINQFSGYSGGAAG
jgi:hypothetical protein